MPSETEALEQKLNHDLRTYKPKRDKGPDPINPADAAQPPAERAGRLSMDNPMDGGASHDFDGPGNTTITPTTNFTDVVGVSVSGRWGSGGKSKKPKDDDPAEQAPTDGGKR